MIFAETDAVSVGTLILSAGAVVVLIHYFVKIWEVFQHKPPLDQRVASLREEISQKYVTKEEFNKLREESNKEFQHVARSLSDIQRTLGNLEGSMKCMLREVKDERA